MRNPVSIIIPFIAPAGTSGAVTLQHDGQSGDKARLAIDMSRQGNGARAAAPLALDGMRQLVDALIDCIYAVERNGRLVADKEEQ